MCIRDSVETVHDDADGEPKEFVDLPHPFGVALGEIVVDGDDMDAAAGERVEIDWQRGNQRLAFTGLHPVSYTHLDVYKRQDRANGYSGAFLMIHGDCSSRGCYAMTDEQIGEIYSLARESFLGGQKEFQIQAYPFRLTPANLARHRDNPNMAFWKMLKEGNDHFEVSHMEPKVDVCDRHYVFDAQPPADSTKPLVFSPAGRCPAYEVAQDIAGPALEKQRNDEYQIAELIKENVPVAPIVMGTDGGMNKVFAGKLEETAAVYDNDCLLYTSRCV